MKLSQRRAEAVREYLVRRGLDAVHIHAVGKGEANPIADNQFESGRILNRRVEFIVRQLQVPDKEKTLVQRATVEEVADGKNQ